MNSKQAPYDPYNAYWFKDAAAILSDRCVNWPEALNEGVEELYKRFKAGEFDGHAYTNMLPRYEVKICSTVANSDGQWCCEFEGDAELDLHYQPVAWASIPNPHVGLVSRSGAVGRATLGVVVNVLKKKETETAGRITRLLAGTTVPGATVILKYKAVLPLPVTAAEFATIMVEGESLSTDYLMNDFERLYIDGVQLQSLVKEHQGESNAPFNIDEHKSPLLDYGQVRAVLHKRIPEDVLIHCIGAFYAHADFLTQEGLSGSLAVTALHPIALERRTLTAADWHDVSLDYDGTLNIHSGDPESSLLFDWPTRRKLARMHEFDRRLAVNRLLDEQREDAPPINRQYSNPIWMREQTRQVVPRFEQWFAQRVLDDACGKLQGLEHVSEGDMAVLEELTHAVALHADNTFRELSSLSIEEEAAALAAHGLTPDDREKRAALLEVSRFLQEHYPQFPLLPPTKKIRPIAVEMRQDSRVIKENYSTDTLRRVLTGENERARRWAEQGLIPAFWLNQSG